MSSKRLHVFDPETEIWTQLQDLPSALSHINLVPGESGFWFAGGMKDKVHPGKDHIIAEVWHYNIELNVVMPDFSNNVIFTGVDLVLHAAGKPKS